MTSPTSDADAANAVLIENLAKFLEKRQKASRSGFMSRAAVSKKGIVTALQTSVMRHRAQQTIRTQVQATLQRATITRIAVSTPPLGASSGAAAAPGPVEVTGLSSLPSSPGAVVPPTPRPAVDTANAVSPAMLGKRLQGSQSLTTERSASPVRTAWSSRGPSAAADAFGAGAVAAASGSATASAARAATALAAEAAVKKALAGISLDADADIRNRGTSVGSKGSGGGRPPSGHTGPAGSEAEEEQNTRVADLPCAACGQPLLDDDGVAALSQHFHVGCFACAACETPFNDASYYVHAGDGKAYCKADYLRVCDARICAGCMQVLQPGEDAFQVRGGRSCGAFLPSCFSAYVAVV
jgi:hypothetical protein